MQIIPVRFISGNIIVTEKIPSLSVGRTLVATVLSEAKDGNVLVSLFGKRMLVETTIPLHRGQVLNLRVDTVSPRIILKPAQPLADPQGLCGEVKTLIQNLVGTYGETPLASFTAEEILEVITRNSSQDKAVGQFVSMLMDQVNLHPQAIAYFFVPLVQEDSRSHARISIERQDQAYSIHFEMDTDHLGQLECTARLDDGIYVEIRTPSQETAEYLRSHIHELSAGLEPLDVRSCEVIVKQPETWMSPGVDVLV